MLTLYQKYHTYLNLLLLTLLGLACGIFSGSLLEAYMDPLPAIETATVKADRKEAQQMSVADLNSVLRHNIFDPASRTTSATLDLSQGTESGQDDAAATRQQIARKNMTLFGTVVAGADSLALIGIDKDLDVYHLQDLLPGGGTIEEIARNVVKIRNADQSLTILQSIEDKKADSPGAAGNAENASAASDANSGIHQIAKGHWVVPRETAENTRANLGTELRLAQMQPRITDGKTDGFMIRRLRRNSILNKLGLQRGDVVLNVNGMSLNSPEAALQIFQQLREARQITVGVERKGEAMTFSYELD